MKLGWTSQKDMETTAQILGVNAFLDAHISYIPAANQVMLSVKIFSVSNGTILWAETYSVLSVSYTRCGNRTRGK